MMTEVLIIDSFNQININDLQNLYARDGDNTDNDLHLYMILECDRIVCEYIRKDECGWKVYVKKENNQLRILELPNEFLGEGVEDVVLKEDYLHIYSTSKTRKINIYSIIYQLINYYKDIGNFEIVNDLIDEYRTYNVLYVGQAFGNNGNRTPYERLSEGHKHLQKVLIDVNSYKRDRDICILMSDIWHSSVMDIDPKSFRDRDFITVNGEIADIIDGKSLEIEIQKGARDPNIFRKNFKNVLDVVEGALIRYFMPERNAILKCFPFECNGGRSSDRYLRIAKNMLDMGCRYICIRLNLIPMLMNIYSNDSIDPYLPIIVDLATGSVENPFNDDGFTQQCFLDLDRRPVYFDGGDHLIHIGYEGIDVVDRWRDGSLGPRYIE